MILWSSLNSQSSSSSNALSYSSSLFMGHFQSSYQILIQVLFLES